MLTVAAKVDEVKTQTSEAVSPLAPEVVEALQAWRTQAIFTAPGDFAFASDCRTGKHPKAGGPRGDTAMLRHHIKPAAQRIGLGEVGWHTFRHTFPTVANQLGVRVKVAQALMRHDDAQTTMNLYTWAQEQDKREAVGVIAERMVQATKPPVLGTDG